MTKEPADPATRGAILDHLKRHGPDTAGAMAKRFGLTAMAVRLHLYTLEDQGVVTAAPESAEARTATRGRPRKLWELTPEADDAFPDAHRDLAVDLIGAVRETLGEEAMARIVETRGAAQLARYRNQLRSAKDLAARVKRLAEIRTREGYMAEARRDGSGWLLVENHCPICAAARTCTRLCANELEVFQAVLGPEVTVSRHEHILAGARRCAYRIAAAG